MEDYSYESTMKKAGEVMQEGRRNELENNEMERNHFPAQPIVFLHSDTSGFYWCSFSFSSLFVF